MKKQVSHKELGMKKETDMRWNKKKFEGERKKNVKQEKVALREVGVSSPVCR